VVIPYKNIIKTKFENASLKNKKMLKQKNYKYP